MPQAAEAQINVRIDRSLKAQGDEALANAGYSPSQAVRLLWGLAAQYQGNPSGLVAVLEPDRAAQEERQRETERQRRIEIAERGAHVIEEAYARFGLKPPAMRLPELSYEKLKELAFEEKYGKEMGWI